MVRKSIFQLMREAKQAKPSTCEKCHESLDVSWVVCPHCGMPVEDMMLVSEEEDKGSQKLNEAEEDVEIEEEIPADDDLVEEEPVNVEEEKPEPEDVSVNDVLDAVEGLLNGTGVKLTNSYEKAALCFDLESDDGDAHVVYDGRSVQIYGIDDGELVFAAQAETLPDMLDALVAGLSEEDSEEEAHEAQEEPEEAVKDEEKTEVEEESAEEEKEPEKAEEEPEEKKEEPVEEPKEEAKIEAPVKEEKVAPKAEKKSFKNLIKKRK